MEDHLIQFFLLARALWLGDKDRSPGILHDKILHLRDETMKRVIYPTCTLNKGN